MERSPAERDASGTIPAGWMLALRGGLVALPLLGLGAGFAAQGLGHPEAAALAWSLATLAVLAVLLVQVATSLARGMSGSTSSRSCRWAARSPCRSRSPAPSSR